MKNSFEANQDSSSKEEALGKMKRQLNTEVESLKAKKHSSIEDKRKTNLEIQRIKNTLKKLDIPSVPQEHLAKENLDASPKEIARLQEIRKMEAQKMRTPEKLPWWKKVFSVFKKDEPQTPSLDYLKARSAVREAERTQGMIANEYAKNQPVQKTPKPAEIQKDTAPKQDSEDNTDTEELEAVNY